MTIPKRPHLLERTDRNATHQWEEMAPVSVARNAYDGVEAFDGKIYFAGGRKPVSNTNYNLLECYDPVTDQWSTLSAMPTSRGGVATAFLDGKFYAIGGYNGSYLQQGGNFRSSNKSMVSWAFLAECSWPRNCHYGKRKDSFVWWCK